MTSDKDEILKVPRSAERLRKALSHFTKPGAQDAPFPGSREVYPFRAAENGKEQP
jgi:hypothetical protein